MNKIPAFTVSVYVYYPKKEPKKKKTQKKLHNLLHKWNLMNQLFQINIFSMHAVFFSENDSMNVVQKRKYSVSSDKGPCFLFFSETAESLVF